MFRDDGLGELIGVLLAQVGLMIGLMNCG